MLVGERRDEDNPTMRPPRTGKLGMQPLYSQPRRTSRMGCNTLFLSSYFLVRPCSFSSCDEGARRSYDSEVSVEHARLAQGREITPRRLLGIPSRAHISRTNSLKILDNKKRRPEEPPGRSRWGLECVEDGIPKLQSFSQPPCFPGSAGPSLLLD
jgi:hypothetical protein